jgi:hypothetical protein
LPHDHARSRAYRWGEDGLVGISDLYQNLCFAIALWNGKDPILKVRLFGLSNPEGNHGEDVKELYYYFDNVLSHYYMKYLYKYPQTEFPYRDLVDTNRNRSKAEPEYEILDTGVFSDNRYFDVYVEYAKKNSVDIFIKIEIVNRHVEAAELTLLPTLWFYNRWQYSDENDKPSIHLESEQSVKASHAYLGDYYFYFQNVDEVLFTENETNFERLFNRPNKSPFVKDAFHEAIIGQKNCKALRANKQGTKCAPVYRFNLEGQQRACVYLRLTPLSTPLRLLRITSNTCLFRASRKPMRFMLPLFRSLAARINVLLCAKPLLACSGTSNIITTTWSAGSIVMTISAQ